MVVPTHPNLESSLEPILSTTLGKIATCHSATERSVKKNLNAKLQKLNPKARDCVAPLAMTDATQGDCVAPYPAGSLKASTFPLLPSGIPN